jgi:hypothetical protein
MSRKPRSTATVLAGALTGVLALANCTVVEVHGADGSVAVSHAFGALVLELQPASEPTIVSTTVYGLGATFDGAVLGYAEQRLALLGSDCRAVFWVEDEASVAAVQALTGESPDFCVIAATRGE